MYSALTEDLLGANSNYEYGGNIGSKDRTTVSVEESTLNEAREAGLNISRITEKALKEAMSDTDYYFINSNRDTFSDDDTVGTEVYQHGVAVTYGPSSFGEKLEGIEPGDVIFHWVDKQGVRAEGRVTGYWDGSEVSDDERIYPDQQEYHLPTRWLVVLDEDEAIGSTELEEITGRPHPRGTRQKISDDKYNCERLQEVIRGRAVDY